MSRFVLDCSVTMAWCFEDESNRYSESILDKLVEGEALVPSLWPLEVANVLIVGERKKRLTEAQSLYFVKLLNDLPIYVDESTADKAFTLTLSLAREHSLSSYDAAYLELAMREGLQIATQDKALKKAAKKSGMSIIS